MSALIVSDYDGTLKKDENVEELKKNLKILKSFLDDNINIMVSTGRLYKSIRLEADKFEIPFNYMSCANGNILFDEKFQIIYKTNIDSKIINDLQPYYNQILGIEPLDEYGIITPNNPTEYLIHLVEEQEIRRQIVKLLLSSPDVDYCTEGSNKYAIHIFTLSNKTKTIEIVKDKLKLSQSEIYTIGDGINDLDMIKKYNGLIVGNLFDEDKNMSDFPKYETFYSCAEGLQQTLKRGRRK